METAAGDFVSPYKLLLRALTLIPISHYLLLAFFALIVFVYNLLEIHILQDIISGFGGGHVSLTFNSSSDLYREVISKCHLLYGRYVATAWLSSPHLQTILLNVLVKTPSFSYKREIFRTSDGGTVALDWLMNSDVLETSFQINGTNTVADIPLVIVVPGLTSDSKSPYIRKIAYAMAKHGWNVVVCNHRGLGGVPLTSECFYTAGKSDDLGEVVNHLHRTQPETPIYAVGTSLGANILVKYLGEEGVNVPLVGAASISNPWDLLIGDRFFTRAIMQRFYNRVLGNSLKGAAKLHQEVYARLSDWEGIEKSRTIRDFNNYSARIAGNFDSIDAFHRWASSARLVTNVSVPLLCLNAIDDPVCTDEAIPWDECRKNKNIVLATTKHGGHIAFFEGTSGKDLWWIRVVEEYLSNLHASSIRKQQMQKFKDLSSETL
ncbi:embryogenesis-associated protein EMB8-like [Cynara cardunculus var. scolymus]|uniref:embryogenesis-associated protein EMB8-like n=1 Tax=Cynara cardunculus var. scolymus TaxID=59895 RepID=UPI000D62F073|nr:embryogenesis-associated protein EMB8-like [Cynara cardunculus var. scolymus]